MNSKPNIIFIMSDDHASAAVSAYGSRLAKDAPTPNIDRIAREGTRFDNCFCTNAICTPSRAAILTGRHSHCSGVRTLSDPLPENSELLSEILRSSGYRTAVFGKWHLHARPRGFDQWAVLPGQGEYRDPKFIVEDDSSIPEVVGDRLINTKKEYHDEWTRNYHFGHQFSVEGYVTDIITDMSIRWIQEQSEESPFFLCIHHKAPHDFFEYKRVHEAIYRNVVFAEPETLFESEEVRGEISRRYGTTVSERWKPRNMVKHLEDPSYPNGGPWDFSGMTDDEKTRFAYQKYMEDYLRTVHSIDVNVGRVLDVLDSGGQAENTIVIYTSDQGMMLGEHDHIDKRWIFDESLRMPFLMRYPAKMSAGRVNDDVIDNTDFAPTLLDMVGIDVPEIMQGRSFRPAAEDGTLEDWRQSVYYRYWMHMAHHWVPAHYGIRTKQWKLIFFYGLKLDASGCTHPDCDEPTEPGFELYDMVNDPGETTNLVSDPRYTEVFNSLKRELVGLKRSVGDGDEKYPEMMRLEAEFFPE